MMKNRTSTRPLKNDQKLEPGTGGEKPRSGKVQGAFMTRSREHNLPDILSVRAPHGNGTSSASVAMCEAFFTHAQHTP
jgi:hypothetical protein